MRTLLLCSVLAAAACSSSAKSASPDLAMAAPADMAVPPPDLLPSCVTNPMTHVEIINACTNAQAFDKTPFYPTLAPNGQLPPLP